MPKKGVEKKLQLAEEEDLNKLNRRQARETFGYSGVHKVANYCYSVSCGLNIRSVR
jgi:hypothetical protein